MDLLGSSAIVETAIGLGLVFFLAAGICTGVVEAVASLGSSPRQAPVAPGRRLVQGGRRGRHGMGVTRAVRLLRADPGVAPTGDPDTDPVTAFIDGLPGVAADATALRKVKAINRDAAVASLAALAASPPDSFSRSQLGKALGRLDGALSTGATTAEERVRWIEGWFDAEMARLGAAYRSRTRWFAGLTALVLVLALGLDAIQLTTELYQDPARRQVLTAAAGEEVANGEDPCVRSPETETTTTTDPTLSVETQERLECARRLAGSVEGLQVGRWTPTDLSGGDTPSSWGGWVIAVFGMAVSVAALTAGSPWWFSILNGLMRIRTGARPSPSP